MSNQELILAQEQSVLSKSGLGKEIQGTLVLTNSRLLFVAATAEDAPALGLNAVRFYSDVEDLDSVGQNPVEYLYSSCQHSRSERSRGNDD